VEFPYFSAGSATPVKVLVMPDVFLRITYTIDGDSVDVGRWTECGFLPRIGDHVNVLPDDDCLLPLKRVEHFLDDAVVVLGFSVDIDCGKPGSWRLFSEGESFVDHVEKHCCIGGFLRLKEPAYFPDRI